MTRDKIYTELTKGNKAKHCLMTESITANVKGDVITEEGFDFTDYFWNRDVFFDGWEVI